MAEGGYALVLEALESRGLVVSNWGATVSARCSSHEDQRPSLSLAQGDDGKALLRCHAGCSIEAVVEALDLRMSDLFTESSRGSVTGCYTYTDEEGAPLYRVLRLTPKSFSQERLEEGEWKPGMRDVRRVLYGLPRVAHAFNNGETVYVVEGEADADALSAHEDLCVTTLLGGANKWRDEYLDFFKGLDVVVIADNDEPGRAHATMLQERLAPVAASVMLKVAQFGKDVSDHLSAGYGLADLKDFGEGLDEFEPLEWATYEAADTRWLLEPYLPVGGRVLAYGPAGSLKSLWAMWAACHLAREGRRVAYFSLEMLASDTARRLKQLNPPRQNFTVFRQLKLGSPSHTARIIAGLKGYDLIVIDSWTAARSHVQFEGNQEVSALDAEAILPIVSQTGATILILDNTGHGTITDTGVIKPQHARGASSKGDKQECTLSFDRPDPLNNYRCQITVTKMRLDYPMPRPVVVETPKDRINFYYVEQGIRTERPLWPEEEVNMEDASNVESSPEPTEAVADPQEREVTPEERRALARVRDVLKATDLEGAA